MNHNYHVHVNRKGYQNSSAACGGAFAAGHYNPFVVHTNGTYSTDCNPQNQLRCEVGDTSQKTGTIDLDDSAFLRQDSFMPLMGSQSGESHGYYVVYYHSAKNGVVVVRQSHTTWLFVSLQHLQRILKNTHMLTTTNYCKPPNCS